MVEAFKTNVKRVPQAKKLASLLMQHLPGSKVNFDLHDCDKVLRVEADDITPKKIMKLVEENGFLCRVLE